MYFTHKVFIPFLKKVDQNVKKITNLSSLNEDNLVKVIYNCNEMFCNLFAIHEHSKWISYIYAKRTFYLL